MKIAMNRIIIALHEVLRYNSSGISSKDELEKVREDEKERKELSYLVADKMSDSIWEREDFKNAKWWKKLWLYAVDGLSNKRGEGHIPDDIIKDIARFLLPNIKAFFESDEGRAEFEEWKTEQKSAEAALEKKEKSGEKSPL